ncbi:MAG: peroxiredoxin family protein [Planctomycetota bacterium]
MVPHLVRWQDEYGARGLSILYVENGRLAKKEEVAEEIEAEEMNFPVAWDEGGLTCAAYRVKVYPAAFLVGKDGRLLWKGEPSPEESEERIRRALGVGGD